MSKGSRIFALRLPAHLANAVEQAIAPGRRGKGTPRQTFSTFVRAAIVEKLKHRARSRKRKEPKTYVCEGCQTLQRVSIYATVSHGLDGVDHYYCSKCVPQADEC